MTTTKTKRRPLPIPDSNWKSRWLVTYSWKALHRVSEIQWDEPNEMISGNGITLCGHRAWMCMPGFPSRIGLKRCQKCCKILGIPEGDGCPFNAGIEEPT